MEANPAVLLMLTTCADSQTAERLATALVSSHLAACVNEISGIRSTYRWQGAVERSTETLVMIKTTRERYAAVEQAIRATTGYELPEIIAVPIEQGLPAYLEWIVAQTHEAND